MNLIDFLLKAKTAGYATGGEGNEIDFEDGARGFELCEEKYRYVDRYFGFNPFSGTESVYDSEGRLIWIMNYYGSVSKNFKEPSKIYSEIKKAMQQITAEYPFRGPPSFTESGLSYSNVQSGNLSAFSGKETIKGGNDEVYSLFYHGGTIEQNT